MPFDFDCDRSLQHSQGDNHSVLSANLDKKPFETRQRSSLKPYSAPNIQKGPRFSPKLGS
jgi:hypothetical protein